VPLPPHLGREALDHLWPRLAGVVLTGGGDVDPSRFGASRHPSVFDVSPARDALEIDLTRRALDGGRPLLAICRGIQVVNVALGGTLHQDIPSDVDSAINHSQKEPRDQPTHAVKVNLESGLGALLGAAELAVNSFHHQAIDRAGAGIRDVAWAPDGVIEGVEVADHPFLFGVQWHPEDLVGHDAAARRLFRALAEAANRQTVSP
jgi:putative glutamine amidotransferase